MGSPDSGDEAPEDQDPRDARGVLVPWMSEVLLVSGLASGDTFAISDLTVGNVFVTLTRLDGFERSGLTCSDVLLGCGVSSTSREDVEASADVVKAGEVHDVDASSFTSGVTGRDDPVFCNKKMHYTCVF